MDKSIAKRMIFFMGLIIIIGISMLFSGTKVMFEHAKKDTKVAFIKTQQGVLNSIFLGEKEEMYNFIYNFAVSDDLYDGIKETNYDWSKKNIDRYVENPYLGMEIEFFHIFSDSPYYYELHGKRELLKPIKESEAYSKLTLSQKITVEYQLIKDQLYLVAMSPVTMDNKKLTNGYVVLARKLSASEICETVQQYMNSEEYIGCNDSLLKTKAEEVLKVTYVFRDNDENALKTVDFYYSMYNYYKSYDSLLIHVAAITGLILLALLVLLKVSKREFDHCKNQIVDRMSSVANGDYSENYDRTVSLEVKEIFKELNRLTKTLRENEKATKSYHINTLTAIIDAIEEHDEYMIGHSKTVKNIAVVIGRNIEGVDIKQLEEVALLHDVGKIGLPSDILSKPGPLSSKEYKVVRDHTTKGERILKSVPFLEETASIVRQHHERFDGSGYPDHLSKDNIHIAARIVGLADTFEAMISDRSYRKKYEFYQAVAIIKKESGKQFDPLVVEAFVNGLQDIKSELRDRDTTLK